MRIQDAPVADWPVCPHARAHALGEGHPVIEQITGHGMGFAWCYDERRYVR
jgi:hypothetical protein